MTLKETFNQWSVAPGNSMLANRSRDAVNKVLLKEYGDTDLELIDETFAHEIFLGSDVAQELKTKAASILVYVLQWGCMNGYCRRPSFDYSIASKPEVKPADKPKGRKKPQEVIKPQIAQKDTDNLLNTDYKDYKETAAEQPQANPSVKSIKSVLNKKSESDKNICDTQKSPCESVPSGKPEASDKTAAASPPELGGDRGGLNKRTIRKVDDDICQLDPKTLEVVKKWPHALRIKQELGVHNVVRAIERCGQAGGFYWSYAKDLDTFAARLAARQEHNAEVHKNHCAQMRASKTPTQRDRDTEEKKKTSKKTAVASPPENERTQVNQCQSVSSAPNKRSAAQAALEVFTDDELFAELDRRGWFGYFSRTEIVTIGNK